MKEKDKADFIIYDEEEPVESIFSRIVDWEVISQVRVAVHLKEAKRTKLLAMLMEQISNKKTKENVAIIINRVDESSIRIDGFSKDEIEYYRKIFLKEFCHVLHSEDMHSFIEDKIREMKFFQGEKE